MNWRRSAPVSRRTPAGFSVGALHFSQASPLELVGVVAVTHLGLLVSKVGGKSV